MCKGATVTAVVPHRHGWVGRRALESASCKECFGWAPQKKKWQEQERLVTFPPSSSVDLAYDKLALKVANGDHVTMGGIRTVKTPRTTHSAPS